MKGQRRARVPVFTEDTIPGLPAWDGRTFTGASAIGLPGLHHESPGPEHLPPLPPPQLQPQLRPRPADEAIFTLLPDGGFGLLCGMDLWRRHADPETDLYRNSFDALRVSAYRAGWRPDAYTRWCCPVCIMNPGYATPRPLAHYHPGVGHARFPRAPWGSRASADYWLTRRATDYHADAATAAASGDPAAEFWFAVEAEQAVAERTADAAIHGKHRRAGAR